MHVSMLSPWVEGGGADPGEFDIFTRARVKLSTLVHLENVKGLNIDRCIMAQTMFLLTEREVFMGES